MITKFIYNQTQTSVSFEVGNGIMVNATEMAKPFGKLPHEWLRLPSTKEFINELTNVRKSLNVDFQAVITKRGGINPNEGGTWLHEDVALEFARWLSPTFAIWCNDRIKELLTKGHTELKVPQSFAEALQLAADQARKIEEQQKALQAAAPKVEFADTVASSDSSILVGELAKIVAQKGVKIGQNRLFEYLRNNGYLCTRNGNKNYPTQRSINQGLLEVVERAIPKPDGSCIVTFTTKVTGKGQVYFVNLLKGKF